MSQHHVIVYPSGSYLRLNHDGAGSWTGFQGGHVPVGNGEMILIPEEEGDYVLESFVPVYTPPAPVTLALDSSEVEIILSALAELAHWTGDHNPALVARLTASPTPSETLDQIENAERVKDMP